MRAAFSAFNSFSVLPRVICYSPSVDAPAPLSADPASPPPLDSVPPVLGGGVVPPPSPDAGGVVVPESPPVLGGVVVPVSSPVLGGVVVPPFPVLGVVVPLFPVLGVVVPLFPVFGVVVSVLFSFLGNKEELVLTTDEDVLAPLFLLRQREVVHFNRFKELYEYYKSKGY